MARCLQKAKVIYGGIAIFTAGYFYDGKEVKYPLEISISLKVNMVITVLVRFLRLRGKLHKGFSIIYGSYCR